MQHVTFDTAKRLEEAGFPQPMAERGQVWYKEETGKPLLCLSGNDSMFVFLNEQDERVMGKPGIAPVVFAPTAADILARFKPGWVLAPGTPDGEGQCKYWCCLHMQDMESPFLHPNSAEACAMAWLSKDKDAPKPGMLIREQ